MATIDDVSRKAGVSRSTVSRVIAGNGYVSQEKRQAIEAAIAELGYRPNTMARGLRSNRSNIVGVVVGNVASPFYAQMMGGLQQACRSAGRSVLVQSGYGDADAEARAITELLDRACDGLIVHLENPLDPTVEAMLTRARVPVVTVGGEGWPGARMHISIDNAGGAKAAMLCLLDQGHRQIVHLSGGPRFRDSAARRAGIDQALAERGLPAQTVSIVDGDFTEAFGMAATEALIAERRPFTAIFAGDDDIGAGALSALKKAGLRVPEDVSLIGFDDNFHARHTSPSLTTVRQPIEAAGQMAAETLLAILADQAVTGREQVIPATLILRESTGPAPARDWTQRASGLSSPPPGAI